MDQIKIFEHERGNRIEGQGNNLNLKSSANSFVRESINSGYSYNFSWLGRPIIQYPQDIMQLQEIIWNVQPDLIIETGIAHGGSLIFSASILELIGGDGQVLGVDIDIRKHNREAIEKHPMSKRICMIEGSSIDPAVIDQISKIAKGKSNVLVCLDSNHTHDHVLSELRLYSSFVSLNSYLIAFDTIVEHLPTTSVVDRPWGVGNNPKTAVDTFLEANNNFIIDKSINNKLLISVAPDGYLRRIR